MTVHNSSYMGHERLFFTEFTLKVNSSSLQQLVLANYLNIPVVTADINKSSIYFYIF